jgi:hypothetical protein
MVSAVAASSSSKLRVSDVIIGRPASLGAGRPFAAGVLVGETGAG